jgi:hypothetical protein
MPSYPPSNLRHLCSSYCRVQLFRLKGAQRKLKTDRSKIERLTALDMRKRYQVSNKITILYNCALDSLYSLPPFPRESISIDSQQSLVFPSSQNNMNTCATSSTTETSSYCQSNALTGGGGGSIGICGSGSEFYRNNESSMNVQVHSLVPYSNCSSNYNLSVSQTTSSLNNSYSEFNNVHLNENDHFCNAYGNYSNLNMG